MPNAPVDLRSGDLVVLECQGGNPAGPLRTKLHERLEPCPEALPAARLYTPLGFGSRIQCLKFCNRALVSAGVVESTCLS